MKAAKVTVAKASGHSRVAVIKHHDLIETDDFGRFGQLAATDFSQVLQHSGLVHRRIGDVTELTTGAAHKHGPNTLIAVPGDTSGPF